MSIATASKATVIAFTGIAVLVLSSCTTAMPARDNVGNLADVDSSNDPNRIVCKSYKPAGSQHDEKICMTAGQWKKKHGETK